MIEPKDIEKLASLARIAVPADEKEKVRKDVEAVLSYVGQISEAQTMIDAGGETTDLQYEMVHNVMRDDVDPHETGKFTERLLASAPEQENGYVKVKKILG